MRRGCGDSQPLGDLRVLEPLHVMEQERVALPRGYAAERIGQLRDPRPLRRAFPLQRRHRLATAREHPERGIARDRAQPGRTLSWYRSSLQRTGCCEERQLGCVLRVVVVTQDPKRDPVGERPKLAVKGIEFQLHSCAFPRGRSGKPLGLPASGGSRRSRTPWEATAGLPGVRRQALLPRRLCEVPARAAGAPAERRRGRR